MQSKVLRLYLGSPLLIGIGSPSIHFCLAFSSNRAALRYRFSSGLGRHALKKNLKCLNTFDCTPLIFGKIGCETYRRDTRFNKRASVKTREAIVSTMETARIARQGS